MLPPESIRIRNAPCEPQQVEWVTVVVPNLQIDVGEYQITQGNEESAQCQQSIGCLEHALPEGEYRGKKQEEHKHIK
jgi:hypothetical protein